VLSSEGRRSIRYAYRYDKAGNMTTIPQPDSMTSMYTAVYDAWSRQVPHSISSLI